MSHFKDINYIQINRDFFSEISLGNIQAWQRVAFKGFLPNATAGAYIWTGGNFSWRTNRTAVEILSSSANDTAAGTGARTVNIIGVGAQHALTTETVTLNGTNIVQLKKDYFHINQMNVLTTGSSQVNAGNITARVSGGGATLAHIAVGISLSQNSQIMVPAGFAYLVLKQTIGTSSATNLNIHTFTQEIFSSSGVLSRDNIFHISPNGVTPFVLPHDIPMMIPEKTGLAWRISSIGSGTPDVTARIQGAFVDLSGKY
jgi:hypothetical protein